MKSLPLSSTPETGPAAAGVAAALDALQGETIQTFEKEPTGRAMLNVSARLKETRELLDAKRLEAATLTLLESRLDLSKRAAKGTTADAPAPPQTTKNDSLVALWTAMADSEQPDARRIIRNEVIPLYASLGTGLVAPHGRSRRR